MRIDDEASVRLFKATAVMAPEFDMMPAGAVPAPRSRFVIMPVLLARVMRFSLYDTDCCVSDDAQPSEYSPDSVLLLLHTRTPIHIDIPRCVAATNRCIGRNTCSGQSACNGNVRSTLR